MFAAVLIHLELPVTVGFTVGAKRGAGTTGFYPWDMSK
jgi:hypothetical protein